MYDHTANIVYIQNDRHWIEYKTKPKRFSRAQANYQKPVEQVTPHKDSSVEHFTTSHPTLLLLKALLRYNIVHAQFILRLTTYLLNGEKHGCGNILV